jgi:hypothetical protein
MTQYTHQTDVDAGKTAGGGNSRSRFIAGDCARESTTTTHSRSTRNAYRAEEGIQWLTFFGWCRQSGSGRPGVKPSIRFTGTTRGFNLSKGTTAPQRREVTHLPGKTAPRE